MEEPFAIDPEGRSIFMATSDRIEQYYETDVYFILCREVLEYEPDEIFISDRSTMTDFPESRLHYVTKVKEVFNIDITDMRPMYIVDVLDRIVASRKPKY